MADLARSEEQVADLASRHDRARSGGSNVQRQRSLDGLGRTVLGFQFFFIFFN